MWLFYVYLYCNFVVKDRLFTVTLLHTLRAHFCFFRPGPPNLPCPCSFHNPPFYNQHTPYSLFSLSVVYQLQREGGGGEGEGEWVREGMFFVINTYEIASNYTHVQHLPTAFSWRVSRLPLVLVDCFLIDKYLYFFTVSWAACSWLINIRDTIWAFHVALTHVCLSLWMCVHACTFLRDWAFLPTQFL